MTNKDHIWAPKVVQLFTPIKNRRGIRIILTVECDQDFDRKAPAFIGWRIPINGCLCRIISCDTRMPVTPIRKGEVIAISCELP